MELLRGCGYLHIGLHRWETGAMNGQGSAVCVCSAPEAYEKDGLPEVLKACMFSSSPTPQALDLDWCIGCPVADGKLVIRSPKYMPSSC